MINKIFIFIAYIFLNINRDIFLYEIICLAICNIFFVGIRGGLGNILLLVRVQIETRTFLVHKKRGINR